jgi:dTDP-4-amino-4,6-dideoxygalactose transaminase
VKLRHLDEWNARRKDIAATYISHFKNGTHSLPFVPEWADPVWHLFVIRHRERDALQKHLTGAGVQTIIHYPIPPHLSGAYADLGLSPGALPVAEKIAREVLSLPLGPHMTSGSVNAVRETLSSF